MRVCPLSHIITFTFKFKVLNYEIVLVGWDQILGYFQNILDDQDILNGLAYLLDNI